MSRLALSTCWNSARHSDGYAMLKEAAQLGFAWVELGHSTRMPQLAGIVRAVEEGWIGVSSVHSFCPLPPGVTWPAPNHFQPSVADEQEQLMWRRHIEKTAETAARLNCGVVVAHLGSIQRRWWQGDPAKAWPKRLVPGHPVLNRPQLNRLEQLEKWAQPFRTRVLENLAQVAEPLRKLGVKLGLENRDGLEELPLDGDWVDFFEELGEGPWGYWHDTGHAEKKRRQGLMEPLAHLEKMRERLVGFHLHDVDPNGKDHQAPPLDGVDWQGTRTFWRTDLPLTLEMNPQVAASDIVKAREFLLPLLPSQGA